MLDSSLPDFYILDKKYISTIKSRIECTGTFNIQLLKISGTFKKCYNLEAKKSTAENKQVPR